MSNITKVTKEYEKLKVMINKMNLPTFMDGEPKKQIVDCVHEVYDVDNYGSDTLVTTILKNIEMTRHKIRIKECKSKQFKWWWYDKNEVKYNVFLIPGVRCFVNTLLSKEESKIFVSQLNEIFSEKPRDNRIHKAICEDEIIQHKTYERLYRKVIHCAIGGANNYNKLDISVDKGNPILSENMCKKKHIDEMSLQEQFKDLVLAMMNNYVKNLKKISEVMTNLETAKGKKLKVVVIKIKRTIMLYYLQSIIDYKNLLKTIRLYTVR